MDYLQFAEISAAFVVAAVSPVDHLIDTADMIVAALELLVVEELQQLLLQLAAVKTRQERHMDLVQKIALARPDYMSENTADLQALDIAQNNNCPKRKYIQTSQSKISFFHLVTLLKS